MGMEASLCRGTTLNIHFLVGIQSLSMGVEAIRGVFPPSTVCMEAMASPEETIARQHDHLIHFDQPLRVDHRLWPASLSLS